MSARGVALTLGALVAALATPRAASAQNVQLTVSSAGTAFPTPTAADFAAGYVDNPVALAFTGRLRQGKNGRAYTAWVEVCANASTLGGGKALADLQWRPADLSAPFQSIVQGCTGAVSAARLVDAYPVTTASTSFAGGVLFRMILRNTDAVQTYAVSLGVTASLTSP